MDTEKTDAGVKLDSTPLLAPEITTWDPCCPSHPIGTVVRYKGVLHTVIDAGWQGFRLRANR